MSEKDQLRAQLTVLHQRLSALPASPAAAAAQAEFDRLIPAVEAAGIDTTELRLPKFTTAA